MRYILGFGVVLAVANLTGTVETAYAFQAPATTRTPPPPVPGAPSAVENAVQQNLNPTGTTTATTTDPANATQTPPPSGTIITAPTTPTTPANAIQAPAVPGSVTNNPATGALNAQPNMVPGTNSAGITNNRTYSSNYVPGTQPVTTPGAVMTTPPATSGAVGMPGMGYSTATTMAPGTYYQGGVPAGYSSMYVAPGYTTAAPTYYTTQTYPVRQRRGLFGGLFRRRNAQVYTTAPYGYTYGTAPGTYTYTAAPGAYTYAPAPY